MNKKKIFPLIGNNTEWKWIKDSILCNSIEDADIIYISNNTPVPDSFNIDCPCQEFKSDKLYYKQLWNNILKLPKNKLIIGIEAISAVLNAIDGGSYINYFKRSGRIRSIECQDQNDYVYPIYLNTNHVPFYINGKVHLKCFSHPLQIINYSDVSNSYIPIVWSSVNRKFLGISCNPVIMNRVPNSRTIQYLNNLINSMLCE